MADTPINIALDKGLDTVTPPVLTEPGTLVDCLNYEMTAAAGYRRIDGYEKYDGWVGGEIADYYVLSINILDLGIVGGLVPGAIINTVNDDGTALIIGIVVNLSGSGAARTLSYVPINNEKPVIAQSTQLAVGYSTTITFVASDYAQRGSVAHDYTTFIANLRSYSSTLRSMTESFDTPVAGLYWFRRRLVAALDCPVLSYTGDATSQVGIGSIITYNGTMYRVVASDPDGFNYTFWIEPIGSVAVSSDITVLGQNRSTLLHLETASSISLSFGSTDEAYIVDVHNPETLTARGMTTLSRSFTAHFENANTALSERFVEGGIIFLYASAGNYVGAVVKQAVQTGGDYSLGTGAGYVEFFVYYDIGYSGVLNVISAALSLDTNGAGVNLADITQMNISTLAGTSKLRDRKSRYQWTTYNFFGQTSSTDFYGATGASRAFWGTINTDPLTFPALPGGVLSTMTAVALRSWGSIVAIPDDPDIDEPKYVAPHSGSLVLGFSKGSTMRSAEGEPRNFNGLDGATEVATGDAITGLLPVQNDSLIVFGSRSIQRHTGTNSTLQSKVVSYGSGALDYTAVLVGSTPVFAGPSGISSLQQAEVYGDFTGERMSAKVMNTLVPKLVTDFTDITPGGTVMALPVRNKDQYRLWLSTGEVYSVTFTAQGPKIMTSNYGNGEEIRVPFAWSSQVSDSGKEHIHVVWDDVLADTNASKRGESAAPLPDPTAIYELDRGWGFNGVTFEHYIELTHVFPSQGTMSTGVDRIRLHGRSHGLATLNVASSGIEDDYDQDYHSTIQDISLPMSSDMYYLSPFPMTSVVDQANWGLGIKLRIAGTQSAELSTTEPTHTCEVLTLYTRVEGAMDN